MPRDGTDTRTRIMDVAEALILDHGFAASSIDRIIEGAGVTKGAFFYHFASKADLAYALVERFAQLDRRLLEETMARAEKLSRDPLQQVLIFVGLLKEEAERLTEPSPGCLFASCVQEALLFDARTLGLIDEAMQHWRDRLGGKLQEVIDHYPPSLPVAAVSLADMITVIFEGAFIVSKMLRDPGTVAEHLAHYRAYLELLFRPDAERRTAAT